MYCKVGVTSELWRFFDKLTRDCHTRQVESQSEEATETWWSILVKQILLGWTVPQSEPSSVMSTCVQTSPPSTWGSLQLYLNPFDVKECVLLEQIPSENSLEKRG